MDIDRDRCEKPPRLSTDAPRQPTNADSARRVHQAGGAVAESRIRTQDA